MIYISHRGNLNGPNPERENSPEYIAEALDMGYNVEIDVWFVDNKWFLGHDEPKYEVEQTFFYNHLLWCHAKNINALKMMLTLGIHCFWHQGDDHTLTSKGYVWTYPGKTLTTKSICVKPNSAQDIGRCAGVCSDYIRKYHLEREV